MNGADTQSGSPDALLALYEQVSEEIARLRERLWTTGYYFASVAGGLIFLAAQDNYKSFVAPWMCAALAVFQLACVAVWLYSLNRDHNYLTDHRRLRGKLEDRLGYFGLTDAQGGPIIPASWHRGNVTRMFQFWDVYAPLAVGVTGIQIFSIYMVGLPLWTMLEPCAR